jgi:ATP diphosphatase
MNVPPERPDAERALRRLLAIMDRLRDPDGGCPWDLEQSFETIAPYTIEEAYEVRDAIQGGDRQALKDEVGDLLFQVVFHARMAAEEGSFDFAAVADAISDKMERRHPHVFGVARIADAAAQTDAWERHKAAERAAKDQNSLLDDVPRALPALQRAQKLSKRAARVGFDWPDLGPVLDKIDEERGELKDAIATGNRARIADELGDVLFAYANLARHLDLDAEEALRGSNDKFYRRFRYIELELQKEGRPIADAGLDAMEALWQQAKKLDPKG